MGIRTIDDPTESPPPGRVKLIVARDLTPGSNDPEMDTLHQSRSKALHALVEKLGLSVDDWGHTDSETPREVVEIVVPITIKLIEVFGPALVAWLVAINREKKAAKERTPVKEIAVVAPNGSRVQITYRDSTDTGKIEADLKSVLQAAALSPT